MLIQSRPFSQEALSSSLAVENHANSQRSAPLTNTDTVECSEYRAATPARPSMKERLISENFSSPVARRMLAIQDELKALKENEDANIRDTNIMVVEKAKPDQHATVAISPGSIRVVGPKLGEGAQGAVYSSVRLFNESGQTENQALKFSDRPAKSNYLSRASCDRLNLPLQQYELRSAGKNKYCTTHRLGEGDLDHFDVTKGADPIRTYLSIIKDVAKGAAFLHANDILHRDIKPQNIIVISKEEGGQLGDLDMIARLRTDLHITCCTPVFAPPSIWDNSVGKQANRWGVQTKADDVFSLGRTVQYGLIQNLFAKHSETTEQARLLTPRTLRLFDDEDIAKQQIQIFKSKGKVISVLKMKQIQDPSNPDRPRSIPSTILIFPSKCELKRINDDGLDILKHKLTKQEFAALDFAASLAYYMQDESPNTRPTMVQIYNRIRVLQRELISNLPESEPASSIQKRGREVLEVSLPSSGNKRTRLARKPIPARDLRPKPLSI